MSNTLIALAVGYVVGMPVLLSLFLAAHYQLVTVKKIEKAAAPKKKNAKKESSSGDDRIFSLYSILQERLTFLLAEDKRLLKTSKEDDDKDGDSNKVPESGLTNRQMFFIILVIGFLLFISPAYGTPWWMSLIGAFVFFNAIGFASNTAKPITEARKKAIVKMANIARDKLGNKETNPDAIVTVVEWDQLVKPLKVNFVIPHTFNEEYGEEPFLRMFNQWFGKIRTFVPDDRDPKKPGWDYDNETLRLYAVPPLPRIAYFDERYVLGTNGEIAESFFPIGLGIRGGYEVPNPETGEIEHLIGFDLAGEQKAIADEHGYKIASNIASTSPQILIGGVTGSGKAADSDTPVLVRVSIKP